MATVTDESTIIQTEESNLLNKKQKSTELSRSFILADSLWDEIKLTLRPCFLITLQVSAGWGSIAVAIIMVGQLPNSALYLSGVGLASTFVNVTGVAITWGFTTALFTLLPQSTGAGQTHLASIYIQRAFYVVTVISIGLSIIQFFAGDILTYIGQPMELRDIITTYCRVLIPYIFVGGYAAILERTMQSLNLNISLLACYLLQFILTPPLTWLFMYHFECGYYGAAIARCLTTFFFSIAMLIVLLYNSYAYLFIPHNLGIVLTKKGIYEYISLATPGLFQNAFEWIIEELAVILSGYVIQPQIAMSSSVILSNLFNIIVLPVAIGVCNGTNLRVAKYIGFGNVYDAKRAAKVGISIGIIVIFINSAVFILGRNVIPILFTNNIDTIELTSQMMLYLIMLSFGTILLQTVGGIYRGLGQQKIAAIIVFVSYWCIALPIAFILLFGLKLRDDLYYGVTIIIGNLTLGNCLSAIGTIMYLICCIDWKKAVDQSSIRVEYTLKEYSSTNKYDNDNNI
eukprot:445503_1